jgi:hypothetical protein
MTLLCRGDHLCTGFRLSALANGKPAWHTGANGWRFVPRGLEKERYFGAATAQLHRCRCPVATLCFVSLLHWLRFVASLAEKKERERQKKESERKKIGGNEKIDYLFFLEL